MVELSRSIANKIKDKQGDITEDEVRAYKWKELNKNTGKTVLEYNCLYRCNKP